MVDARHVLLAVALPYDAPYTALRLTRILLSQLPDCLDLIIPPFAVMSHQHLSICIIFIIVGEIESAQCRWRGLEKVAVVAAEAFGNLRASPALTEDFVEHSRLAGANVGCEIASDIG